jgi:hypothetical protein
MGARATTANHRVNAKPHGGRRVVAALWGAAVVPYLLVAVCVPIARAVGLLGGVFVPAMVVMGLVTGAAVGGGVARIAGLLPAGLDDWLAPEHRRYVAIWGIGGLLSLLKLSQMAVFLGDSSYEGASIAPDVPFLVHHSCLTAYIHGAILSTDPAANVYDVAYLSGTSGAPLPATAAHFAPFQLDAFGYPPPFLLLPRALLLITRDFLSLRAAFGAASLALAFFACARVAKVLGGVAERRIWLLTPLLLASPVVLVTVQVGNFHLATAALCLLCWVALEKRQNGLTGALLAVATVAKIFPGLLGVVLLTQRRWRAVGATLIGAAALVGVSAAVLGTRVWRDFLFYHLPRVESGEALRFLAESPREIAFNVAPFGIPFKLAALGMVDWGWAEARTFGHVYTAVLFAVAVLVGRKKGAPQRRLSMWLALVMLASLQSPYAAPFVLSTAILLLLVLAAEVRSWQSTVAFVVIWAVMSLPLPMPHPKAEIAVSLARVIILYAFFFWAALRPGHSSEASSCVSARS